MRTRLGAALLLVLLAVSVATGGTISLPYTPSPGTVISSSGITSDFTTIYNDYNGNISDANIAAITETKITFTGSGHAHSGGAGGAPIQLVKGADITSASTLTITTDGNYFVVTGTVTVTALSTRNSGVFAVLKFSGSLLLTHNATSLILPGAANITTAAGDIALFVSEGSGNWRGLFYQRVGAGAGQGGSYGSRNLVGVNNAGTPNTKFDVAADLAAMRNPTDGSIIAVKNTGTITNDVGLTGPAANGRDVSGAFSASSWIHFYWIGKADGTGIATVSSATAPPTGPALPSTYPHWGYIGAVRFDGSSHLVKTRIRGNMAYIVPVVARSTAAGTGSEQSYDLSANIPPNHQGALVDMVSNRNDLQGDIRASTGGDVVMTTNYTGTNVAVGSASGIIPLDSQTLYFIGNATHGILLRGYKQPNGGE